MSAERQRIHLAGERVTVRNLEERDFPELETVMSCPGVRAWWWDFDIGKFAEDVVDDLDIHPLVIERDGRVIGYMQFEEEDSAQYHFAGIDLSIHDDHQGSGNGSDAVGALVRYLVDERGHHRVTIDPAAHNERAIRCYSRVGFRPVGVLRDYERGPDGTWHDGLLMDLLASDLT